MNAGSLCPAKMSHATFPVSIDMSVVNFVFSLQDIVTESF